MEAAQELSREQIAILCRDDPSFFGAVAMPETFTSPFPDFYVQVFKLLISNIGTVELFRFALGLPRGHAKTTFLKLLVCYCLQYGLTRMVLVMCATDDLAQNFVDDVHEMLGSPNMENVYGAWNTRLKIDNRKLKVAERLQGKQVLVASGIGTSIRGLNLLNERPDLIILDDAQTRENDLSPTERALLLNRIAGTILKARNYSRCLFLYVGNMYSENCILQKFRENSQWASLITGAILADGTPLWPEIQSLESLKSDYIHDAELGLADIWFAEVQNQPSGSGIAIIDSIESMIPKHPDWEIIKDTPLASFITIDPAPGNAGKDSVAITVHRYYGTGMLDIPELISGALSPMETVKQAFSLALKYGALGIFPEGVAYQSTLAFWLKQMQKDLGVPEILISPIYAGRGTKNARILGWLKKVAAGAVSISGVEARTKLYWQTKWFRPQTTKNIDDELDSASMSDIIINKYPEHLNYCIQHNRFTYTIEQNDDIKVIPNSSAIDTRRRLS